MPRQCFFYIPLLLPVPVSSSHIHSFSITAFMSFLFCHVDLLLCLFFFPLQGMALVTGGCCPLDLPDFLCPSVLPSMGLTIPVLCIIQSLLSSNPGSVLCCSHSSFSSGPRTPLFHGYYNHRLSHPQPVLPY